MLLIGDASRSEFREVVAALAGRVEIQSAPTVATGLIELTAEPDLCVLLASRPGEFSADEIERFRRVAPLARVIGILGSWCEGESRSGHPWPGVRRIYWHQGVEWFERELRTLADGECGTLSLPLTSTEEERLLHPASLPQRRALGTIALHSSSREMAVLLAEGCRALGFDARPVEQVDGAFLSSLAAGIWDAGTLEHPDWNDLRDLVARWPGVPWIALMNFPRSEDRERVLACGGRAVLSKPLLLDDLQLTLERLRTAASV